MCAGGRAVVCLTAGHPPVGGDLQRARARAAVKRSSSIMQPAAARGARTGSLLTLEGGASVSEHGLAARQVLSSASVSWQGRRSAASTGCLSYGHADDPFELAPAMYLCVAPRVNRCCERGSAWATGLSHPAQMPRAGIEGSGKRCCKPTASTGRSGCKTHCRMHRPQKTCWHASNLTGSVKISRHMPHCRVATPCSRSGTGEMQCSGKRLGRRDGAGGETGTQPHTWILNGTPNVSDPGRCNGCTPR